MNRLSEFLNSAVGMMIAILSVTAMMIALYSAPKAVAQDVKNLQKAVIESTKTLRSIAKKVDANQAEADHKWELHAERVKAAKQQRKMDALIAEVNRLKSK
jgi:hypothetical protein